MWIVILLIAIVVGYLVITYNSFISLRNRTRNAWADIDVQLKRRHDLVPNLVEAVKGYATHEKAVLEDVARLRAGAMGVDQVEEREGTETELAGAIKTLFAVAESYPELRADSNFRQLQSQLSEIEEHIQYARRYYNAVVRDMNTKREVFPSNLVAAWFSFDRLPYFQAEEDERAAVKVTMTGGTS
ncbi:MAG: LemA family protein [Armatimonadetes bacterium]|nr:LemA family protein [Armatimonadota bacterium]